jgi:putative endonuclease
LFEPKDLFDRRPADTAGVPRDPEITKQKTTRMPYYIYILASKRNGTLYVGSTSNLIKRIWQHKNKVIEGFTFKYHVDKLVYYEEFQDIRDMAYRERRLKEWKRFWKVKLIEQQNPNWNDLYFEIIK